MTQYFNIWLNATLNLGVETHATLYTASTPCTINAIDWKLMSLVGATTDPFDNSYQQCGYLIQVVRQGFNPILPTYFGVQPNGTDIIGMDYAVNYLFRNDSDDENIFATKHIFSNCNDNTWSLGTGDRVIITYIPSYTAGISCIYKGAYYMQINA